MTEFDPKFAREVLERRRDELIRSAARVLAEKYMLQMDSELPHWDRSWDSYDKRARALWDQADSYDGVLAYVDGRILDKMTPAERVWSVIKDWHVDVMDEGWMVKMIRDVIEVHTAIENGERF